MLKVCFVLVFYFFEQFLVCIGLALVTSHIVLVLVMVTFFIVLGLAIVQVCTYRCNCMCN